MKHQVVGVAGFNGVGRSLGSWCRRAGLSGRPKIKEIKGGH